MAYPPISALPASPSRQDPANFATEADAFLGALPTFQTQVNAAGTYIDGVGTAADADATSAAASAASAAASAAAAAQVASVWVSGGSYTAGNVRYSPINFLTYRAKTTHSGITTDPSLDATRWENISGFKSLTDFGVTATSAEVNLIDNSVSGTIVNGKAVIYGAAGQVNATTLQIGGVSITATAAELNYNDITTLGTSQASKVVTADASGDVKFANSVIETVYALSGTTPALNPTNGTIQTWTLSASSTPTDGLVAGESLTLMIDDGTAYAITWPSVTWKTGGGVAPTLNATGFTAIQLWKVGSTLYGARVGDA